jgi:hypothetical protein
MVCWKSTASPVRSNGRKRKREREEKKKTFTVTVADAEDLFVYPYVTAPCARQSISSESNLEVTSVYILCNSYCFLSCPPSLSLSLYCCCGWCCSDGASNVRPTILAVKVGSRRKQSKLPLTKSRRLKLAIFSNFGLITVTCNCDPSRCADTSCTSTAAVRTPARI